MHGGVGQEPVFFALTLPGKNPGHRYFLTVLAIQKSVET
jgi:hypothetical protein